MISEQNLLDSDNDSENSMHDLALSGTVVNNCDNDKERHGEWS